MASVQAFFGYRFKDRSLLIGALHVPGMRNISVGSRRLALLGEYETWRAWEYHSPPDSRYEGGYPYNGRMIY